MVVSCCSLAAVTQAQTPRPKVSPKPTPRPPAQPSVAVQASPSQSARPIFRPAVLASGPDSLVNRIDVKALLQKGQKDGAVQFAVTVGPDGRANDAWTYHATRDCAALEHEVLAHLDGAKFTPPIYNYQPVTVILYGTVTFDADTPPHLHVLLNQDVDEIARGSDFVGPQPVIGGDSQFHGLRILENLPVAVEGVVDLVIRVDEKGNLQGAEVANEVPPLLGFGEAAADDFAGAKFIPGFRDGDATESTSVMSVCYKPQDESADPNAPGLQLQVGQP